MKPTSNIVFYIQYLTIFLFGTFRKTSILKSTNHAGRHVVGFAELFIDDFLKVQNERYG